MDHLSHLSSQENQKFLEACKVYIERLMKDGKLKAAQPLIKEGKIISGSDGKWKEEPFNESSEVMVGYYHVIAEDLDEAVAIAKENPEFRFTPNARIEVRPIKMKEAATQFTYPGSN
jgi:hypothetical protein